MHVPSSELYNQPHPVVSQLKSDLKEGIWTDSTLLDLPLAEISEGENVAVDIISQGLGYCQGLGDLLLTLRETHPNY